MPSSTSKRVVLYRFDRQPLPGVVKRDNYLLTDGIQLITTEGTLHNSPYSETKALCFVAGDGAADLFTVDTRFDRRPKMLGLWSRFRLRDGDQLEGMLSPNLTDWPQVGYLLTPPKSGSTRQQVFLPRVAVIRTELLGVVGATATRLGKTRPSSEEADQLRMFDR